MVEIDISGIIPAFNARDTIGDTLESILEQDFNESRFEVVVVDNGSSDGTADRVKAIPQARRFYTEVVTERNSAVSMADTLRSILFRVNIFASWFR